MSRFRSLLATLRIANAPSVVSNVWLGYVFGWLLWFGGMDPAEDEAMQLHRPVLLCLAGMLLYFSGNLANDWYDRKWDQVRRPERALPSGVFKPAAYLAASILLAAAGVALSFFLRPACGICALLIVALIGVYTRFHKQAIWPVIPMGLCRAGLYGLGFAAVWPDLMEAKAYGFDTRAIILDRLTTMSTMAGGLFSYVVGLSLSARYEGMENPPRGPLVISRALLLLPLIAMSCWISPVPPLLKIVGLIPFILWLALCFSRYRNPIPKFVSALLAGIPLVDFIAAAPLALSLAQILGEDGIASIPDLPYLPTLLVVPLAAFILGRLLQKLAPAT